MTIDIKVEHKLCANTGATLSADIHPTEPWLLTGYLNGEVKICNLDSGAVIHTSQVGAKYVKYIARKNWYAVGSRNGKLHIFDCTSHEELVSFKAHDSAITCLAVHPTASIILTSSNENTIKAWDWDNEWRNIQTYEGHTDWVPCIAFNPKDPETFVSGCDDGTIKMWSIGSPVPACTIQSHNQRVFHIDFYLGVDKPYFITASYDKTVKIWDYLSQKCIQTVTGHTSSVTFAVFHPSLPIIISGSWDGSVRIWNSRSYGLVRALSYEFGWVRCIALRKTTSKVVVGYNKALITLELSHSGPSQVVASSSDVCSAASKNQVTNLLDGRDIKEPAIKKLTGPEDQLRLAHSLNNLTTTFDTTLSLSPTPPSQSSTVLQHEMDLYQECITVVMELFADKAANKLISELRDDQAQDMVEFLSKESPPFSPTLRVGLIRYSQMVNEENSLTQRDRKHAVYLLSKLSKSAQVFPQSLKLEGVQFNLANPFTWGGYGLIFKGSHQGNSVCVKAVQVDLQGSNQTKLRAHAGELSICAHLSHRNVLPFLGISPSAEEVSRVCIVSPWMENGDLLQYLRKVPGISRKPLVRDVISGLKYLHDLDIIHADLKAKNVLISETGRAMLADFGISRLSITRTTILTSAGTGTAYWMAPELLLEQKPPSHESDIWAFACTCYEIITGLMPFNQYYVAPLLIGAFMMNKVVPLRPEEPGVGWDEDVWSVAMGCWKADPGSRPKAQELLDTINSFDFTDDRPSDPQAESYKRKTDVKIDYNRILSILEKVRQLVVA